MITSGVTLNALIIFISVGVGCGFLYDFFKGVKKLAKDTYFINIFCDFIFCVVAGILFNFIIYKYEFGVFALFEIVSFFVGIIFHQIFVSKMFANIFNFVYNKLKTKKKKTKERE